MSDHITLSAPAIRRAIFASTIGNGLEWFDFIVFGFFSTRIAATFFPADSPALSLILTWSTFLVGFVVRPFGGVVLGMYADRAGRQRALSLLILMMALGTVLLGITPGYATIGLVAPALIVLSRVLQGLSVGGEFASSTAMLVEYAPPGRRMLYGAFQMSSQSFAVTCSAGLTYLLTELLPGPALENWGWRIPFLLGGLVGPVGFYIRRRVAESPEFTRLLHGRKQAPPAPLSDVVARHWPAILCAMGTIVCGTAATYLWNSYLPSYVVRTLHLPLSAPLLGIAVCGLLNMGVNPAAGALADQIGPWRVWIPAVVLTGLVAYPSFAYVVADPTPLHLFGAQLISSLLLGCMAGPIPGLLAGMFPTAVRSTAMSISYNGSVTLFGGMAPLTVTWLSGLTGSPMIPAFYLVAAAIVALGMALGFRAARPGLHAGAAGA
jgi:MFS family permease